MNGNDRPVLVDAHGHLTDLRWGDSNSLDQVIEKARVNCVGFFMQGGVDPHEWDRQVLLLRRHPKLIGLCFGVHPYFVAQSSAATCDEALNTLSKKVLQARALGEIGLDFRSQFIESRELQIELFSSQLELAQVVEKPVVCHIVRAHDEAIKILDFYGLPKAGGMIHSFNGNWKKAESFLRYGLKLSVGGPLCFDNAVALKEVVKRIPRNQLLIESDCPDQGGPMYSGQSGQESLNPPESVHKVAEEVSRLWECSIDTVVETVNSNFVSLFGDWR